MPLRINDLYESAYSIPLTSSASTLKKSTLTSSSKASKNSRSAWSDPLHDNHGYATLDRKGKHADPGKFIYLGTYLLELDLFNNEIA